MSPRHCDLQILIVLSLKRCRHPFFRRYGTILPNSLASVLLSRLGFCCQGHLYWFLVRSCEKILLPFSVAFGFDPTFVIPRLHGCSSQQDFSVLFELNAIMHLHWACPQASDNSLRCRAHSQGSRILTAFPFDISPLRIVLGPTNSWLIIIAKKPLPFRRPGFSPGIDATSTKIFITT